MGESDLSMYATYSPFFHISKARRFTINNANNMTDVMSTVSE